MKSLSARRSSLSKNNIDILKKLILGENMEEDIKSAENIGIENKIHDNALGVLYKSLHDNKNQRKPLVYFFVGLLVGILSTFLISALLLVSDKDTIETDVKTVKENIMEEKQINDVQLPEEVNAPTEGIVEDEDGSRVYIVKQGDTLGGIVNRLYGDTSTYNPEKVEKFKEVNGLKSIHVLKIGQKLVIPD